MRLVLCKVVKGDDFPIVGEHHFMEDGRGKHLHDVHITMSEEEVVADLGINEIYIEHNHHSP